MKAYDTSFLLEAKMLENKNEKNHKRSTRGKGQQKNLLYLNTVLSTGHNVPETGKPT